jgi:UDP-4-amino-4-deoxy-L-arabinose-oxoglutarate aminotransferase
MTQFGWKYNMDNIQAALLLPQLDRLDDNWVKRKDLAEYYQRRLWDIRDLSWPATLPKVVHAWHLFSVWIGDGHRDRVIQQLQSEGISVMVNYRAIHLLTYFRETFGFRKGDFPFAESIGDASLSLPFYPGMPRAHADLVAEELTRALERCA